MKVKNEKMDTTAAIEKCDSIGGSKVDMLRKARQVKKLWMEQSDENIQQVRDYIFGNSDENPFQELQDAIDEKNVGYDEKIDSMIESVKKQSVKQKINR